MRITIINQYYPPDLSPTAHLVASLAMHLASRGDDVTVVTSEACYAIDSDSDSCAPKDSSNLKIIRAWAPSSIASSIFRRAWQYFWFYLAATWRLLILPRQDLIISLTTPPYIAWAAVLHRWIRSRKCKIIVWSMDVYPDILEATKLIKTNGIIARVLSFVNRRLFRRLDHIVCLDNAMVNRLRKYAPNELPMTVIPNWESAALSERVQEAPRWDMNHQLGLADKLVVLYLGNAGYGHDVDTVLAAAEKLQYDPVLFLFVGGGSKHSEIKSAINQRGLKNVRSHDYVPESLRPSVLAAGDLALITLENESLGLMCPSKLHAYLAAGLPILYVGPQGSNVDHAIKQFGCGVRVANKDSDGVARFILAAFQDREILSELSENVRRAFGHAYSEVITHKMHEILIANCLRGSNENST